MKSLKPYKSYSRSSGLKHSARRLLAGCLVVSFCILLSGCGSRKAQLEQLQAYTERMQDFCDTVSSCQKQMDGVDAQAEDAQEILLCAIDEMAQAAVTASRGDVPEGYEDAGEMCRKAADYLQEAKGEYHAAFDSETVDQTALLEGNRAYQSAGRCISLMLDMLDNNAGEYDSDSSQADRSDTQEDA